jgi:alcohol dehydrogenase class IV
LDAGLPKFVRFARNVMDVCGKDKSDRAVAEEGLKALETWMREIGLVMNITELGATEAMLPQIADSTFLLTGGYKTLTREEVIEILRESL